MDNKAKILDIAMNLNRIGNWAADGYLERRARIITFLDQTSDSLSSLKPQYFSGTFRKTFERFLNEYPQIEKEGRIKPKDELIWAEKMMTWGNILTHRAELLRN